jgi:pyrophosphatase PpaX
MKTYLFDWDGCIASSLQLWIDAWEQTFSEYGFNFSDREIVTKAFGNWGLPVTLGIKDGAGFIEKMYRRVDAGMPNVKLEPEAKRTLQILKQMNKQIAIITSTRRNSILSAIHRHGLDDIFDVVLGEEDVRKQKPHPEIVLKAMEILKARPANTIVIGDSDKDILAAKNAGTKAGWYYPATHAAIYRYEKLMQYKPDYVFSDFSQILKLET